MTARFTSVSGLANRSRPTRPITSSVSRVACGPAVFFPLFDRTRARLAAAQAAPAREVKVHPNGQHG